MVHKCIGMPSNCCSLLQRKSSLKSIDVLSQKFLFFFHFDHFDGIFQKWGAINYFGVGTFAGAAHLEAGFFGCFGFLIFIGVALYCFSFFVFGGHGSWA